MSQREPEKLRERKSREKERELKIQVVKSAANQLLEKDALIPNSRLLQEKISDDFHMSVGSKFVRYVMKREMKLRYHRMRKVQPRALSAVWCFASNMLFLCCRSWTKENV